MTEQVHDAADTTDNPQWLRLLPDAARRRLAGRTHLLNVIHNTGWLFVDKVMRALVGVLVGAWVARYLGPSEFGELAYVLAFVAFFSVVSQLGLDGVAIRDMALRKQASSAILGTVLRLRLLSGIVCWCAAIGAMMLLRPGDTQSLILTSIVAGSVLFQAADSVDLWFQSQTQSKRTVLAKAFAYLISNGVRVLFILAKAPLAAFAFVNLLEIGLAAIALWVSYQRYSSPERWTWDRQTAGRLSNECWPYLLSGLAVIVYIRIDQIMLRELVNEHDLGIYSAALPLSTAFYFIPVAISMSVGPLIAQRRVNDTEGYLRALSHLFSLMWWIMLPLSATVALFSKPLVLWLYGPAYAASAGVLAIHVFSNIPVALGVIQSTWIVNERRSNISLYRTLMGAACNVALNLILIPSHGAVGAAIATLCSQVVAAILSNIVLAPNMLKMQIRSVLPTTKLRENQ
ncbi:flippase [Piscinibacter sp.]|jgi:PST family polysaccharide transporter|uniref:flippase n=1 Tax=Piscinibacter sp. TaxID=1903157 RepID=UPI002F4291BF